MSVSRIVKSRSGLWVGLSLSCAVPSIWHGLSAGTQAVTLKVDDPRPLAAMVDALERRYGWVITYEELPYVHAMDIADQTLAVRRDSRADMVLVPRGGALAFTLSAPAVGQSSPDRGLLETLLDRYHSSGLPGGTFRLLQVGSGFHVIPATLRNAQGALEPRTALLDTAISIADAQRNALQMVQAITNALTESAGIRVVPGTMPTNLLHQTRVQGGAQGEVARSVLLRTLGASKLRLSWRLLCTPGSAPRCALNVHGVRD